MKESAVIRECLTYLGKLPDVHLFRNHTGRAMFPSGMTVAVGIPSWGGGGDFIGWQVIDGQAVFLSVEFKRDKGGRRSEAQIKWASDVNRAGGRAVFLASLDDCRREFPVASR